MKTLLTFIAVLATSLSSHASSFYQFNRWTTNVDGKLQDGSTITNLHDPTTVGTLNVNNFSVSGITTNLGAVYGSVQTNTGAIKALEFVGSGAKLTGVTGVSGIATNGGSGLGNSFTNAALNGATNFGPLTFLSGPADTNPQFITNANAQFYFGNIQGKADITAKNFTATGQFTGSGAGLVSVPNSALSANIARLDVLAQAFAGTNTFPSVIVNGGTSNYLGGLTVTTNLAGCYRAGTTNIGNLATSLLVTFTSPFQDANYAVGLTFDSAVASAVSAAATGKTTNGFTISLSAGIAGGANLDYSAWPYR